MDEWTDGMEGGEKITWQINTTAGNKKRESFKRFLHFGKCEQGADCDVTKGTADNHLPRSSLQPPGQVAGSVP